VLVPEVWTVKQGHDLCEEIELAIAQSLPGSYVFTHLEPLEDPLSWQDQQLDRLP
jgi:divalent metal cation (Fe/Co/Zn/Cd) transporter